MKRYLKTIAVSLMLFTPIAAVSANEIESQLQKAEQATQLVTSININTATAEQIELLLNGVGIKKAAAIVEYRENHGDFTSLEQLKEVKGIGEKTIEKNAEFIRFE